MVFPHPPRSADGQSLFARRRRANSTTVPIEIFYELWLRARAARSLGTWGAGRALSSNACFQAPDLPGLTDRQREILGYVALGYTNPEIARACGISKFTVRNQLVRLFERFGVATRTELAQLVSSSLRR